jgi:AcrR family transcriptional regulator
MAVAARDQDSDVERRRRAIAAARSLAEAGGYEAVQVRDVVRLTGLSSATIYRHFSSKDHLIAAAQLELVRSLRLPQASKAATSGAERVAELLAETCRSLDRSPKLAKALIRARASSDAGVSECRTEADRLINDLIREAVAGESIDVEEFVTLLGLAWEGALYSWTNGMLEMKEVGHLLQRTAKLLIAGAGGERKLSPPGPGSPRAERRPGVPPSAW